MSSASCKVGFILSLGDQMAPETPGLLYHEFWLVYISILSQTLKDFSQSRSSFEAGEGFKSTQPQDADSQRKFKVYLPKEHWYSWILKALPPVLAYQSLFYVIGSQGWKFTSSQPFLKHKACSKFARSDHVYLPLSQFIYLTNFPSAGWICSFAYLIYSLLYMFVIILKDQWGLSLIYK